ncbi:MAG TPA: peptidylprolyl isomerase [Pseudomonas sp.]|jgi:peptidyl-prolyl cis-trans isomerase C|nr:peptidylprolyl isomerase [Pseudomonas sp.]
MACGCGGSESGGGCGGHAPAAVEVPAAPLAENAAVELIASSEQEWPRIRVNGVAIAPEAMAREIQYHPAPSRDEALYLACRALVIRELLQQRIGELGIQVRPAAGESEEEAATRELLRREVVVPRADEATCRDYYERNRERFTSAPLVMARHILLACPPDDVEERSRVREQAEALLAELRSVPERFAALALAHSACPSKEQGGALGQISKGQTVPEFERQLLRLPVGIATRPLESRYGFHLVEVEQRIEGRQLPYEAVADAIRDELDQGVWQVAVGQYLRHLLGAAEIQGIHLDGAETPLMQ